MKRMIAIALLIFTSVATAGDSKAETKTGKLSTNSTDDKTIVAILHVEEPGEAPSGKGKKKKAAPPSNSISLVASGDIATKLADYITKNSMVEVKGKLADGKMTVTDVKEISEPSAKKKKK